MRREPQPIVMPVGKAALQLLAMRPAAFHCVGFAPQVPCASVRRPLHAVVEEESVIVVLHVLEQPLAPVTVTA